MPASELLGMDVPAPGTRVNTWGGDINVGVFDLLEQKAAGVGTVTLTGNYSLTNTNFVRSDTKKAVLVFNGSGLTGGVTVTTPASQNVWLVVNNSGQILTFSNGGGSTVALPVGRRGWLFSTGTGLVLFDAVGESASVTAASATQAANSATSAASAAGTATTAKNDAVTARNDAQTARTDAQTARTQAQAAQTATEAAYDSFDDRYLGAKASNPTLDNDGNALIVGAIYFNTAAGEMRVWSGSAWGVFVPSAASYYTKTQTDAAFQPKDGALTSLAGLSLVSGDLLYATGDETIARRAKGTDGQRLGLVSGLPQWVDNPGIIPMPYPAAVGASTFHVGPITTTATTNGALTANLLYLLPVYASRATNLTTLKVQVSTANGSARLGIYAATSTGAVGALLLDAGAQALTTGLNTFTFSSTALPQGWSYFAFLGSSSPSLTVITTSIAILGWTSPNAATAGLTSAQTYGALPTNPTPDGITGSNGMPVIIGI